eukprot:2564725-Rhodomonas_salina.1
MDPAGPAALQLAPCCPVGHDNATSGPATSGSTTTCVCATELRSSAAAVPSACHASTTVKTRDPAGAGSWTWHRQGHPCLYVHHLSQHSKCYQLDWQVVLLVLRNLSSCLSMSSLGARPHQ